MCYSATASFTVGTVLAVTGAMNVGKVRGGAKILLALIPIFFGLQQYAEGVVWLSMNGTIGESWLTHIAPYVFLFFAWAFWPMFIPLSVVAAETVQWKKVLFWLLFAAGVYVAYVDLSYIAENGIVPKVVQNSISYGNSVNMDRYVYGAIVMIPLLISSIEGLWVFGSLVLVSFAISQWVYHVTFTSVWCFFAAAVSIVSYFIL